MESEKKTIKKKRVSFKFGLETSDDLHIVKKEPNALLTPTASIIKKECLTRAIRIARGGESIIMPSRLSSLTGLNNVDKLNSLTFKSQKLNCTNQIKTNNDDSDEDESHDHTDKQKKSKESESENSDNDDDRSINNHSEDKECTGVTNDEHENAATDKEDDEEATPGNPNEKKFVLPKRSVHSSRVIKPNKKFIDESQASILNNKKNAKKKSAKAETSDNVRSGDGKVDAKESKNYIFVIMHSFLNLFSSISAQESDGSTLKLSDHIKNNPFAKIIDSNPFEMSSKSLLRQSRLQFAAPIPTLKSTIANNSNGNDSIFASTNLAGSSSNHSAMSRKSYFTHFLLNFNLIHFLYLNFSVQRYLCYLLFSIS